MIWYKFYIAAVPDWLTISNLNCQEGTVNVFDSFYNDIDKESKLQIANILKPTGKNIKFNIIPVQRQAGGTECGLFAIAFAVALGLGYNPTKLLFKQESMRGHLIDCLTKQEFSNFPFSINTNWRKKKTVIIRENIFVFAGASTTAKWFSAPAALNGSIFVV